MVSTDGGARTSSSSSGVKSFLMLNVLRISSGVLPARQAVSARNAQAHCSLQMGSEHRARTLYHVRHRLARQVQQRLDVHVICRLNVRVVRSSE
jgi:hypothetical protein